jgi:hypothetical protein
MHLAWQRASGWRFAECRTLYLPGTVIRAFEIRDHNIWTRSGTECVCEQCRGRANPRTQPQNSRPVSGYFLFHLASPLHCIWPRVAAY